MCEQLALDVGTRGTWECLACGVSTSTGAEGLYCTPCDERIKKEADERREALRERRRRARRERSAKS